MLDFVFDPEVWKKTLLTPEANAATDVLTGQKSVDQAVTDYGSSYITGNVLDSGADALGNATTDQLYNDAVNIPTKQAYPPSLESSGLQDSGVAGQANIKLGNDALNPTIPQQGIDITNSQPTGVQLNDNAYQSINTPSGATNPLPDYQFDGYTDSGSPSVDTPKEAPGTFLGLEGKDYTKMGMQGVMAAGLSSLKPTQTVQSKAQVGEGITKGKVMQPQGGMQGVNSMVAPDPRLNSMQMTQAQGLISPFQQDIRRRRGY